MPLKSTTGDIAEVSLVRTLVVLIGHDVRDEKVLDLVGFHGMGDKAC